jgi:DNA primase
MAEDNISRIKERLNISDVISGYIKIQKAGANFKARCPFHNEKSASFYISPERQIWHCFGCQKGGDVFGFVKEIEGIEFVEALQILAQKAGIKLEKFSSENRDEKTILYEVCETSTRFFEKQLYHSVTGKKALAYLKDRGLSLETVKDFRLGFAPDGWHNLGNFLRDCDFKDQDIINSGLAIKSEGRGDMHDRFRSRIIFPIADVNDRIVGFTGRVFEDATATKEFPGHPLKDPGAKYINTPQTAIYDKSRVLYGLNMGKTEARRADRCLLVEGNIDAIMSYQAGVKNVAATSGTALTPSHLQLLQRYTNNLDLCFDTDQAGLLATRRGIGLALSQNFNIKIVHLHEEGCKDPADYVKKFGPKWQDLVNSSKPVIEFYFDKLKSELDLASADGKKAAISIVGPLVKRVSSRVEKSHWISKLAVLLKTKEEAVEADIATVKDDLAIYQGEITESPLKEYKPEIKSPNDLLLEAMLTLVVKNPPLFAEEIKTVRDDFLSSETGKLIGAFKKADLGNFKFDKFVKKFDGEKKMKLEFAYLRSQELYKEFEDRDLKTDFDSIKNQLERISVKAQLAGLEMDLRSAQEDKDHKKVKLLLNKFSELNKELK